jgi:hypothetical protein
MRQIIPYFTGLFALAGLIGNGAIALGDTSIADELNRRLVQAQPGHVVIAEGLDLGEDKFPVIKVERVDTGGPQLLLSDMPEYFNGGDGIAMQERVEPGIVRLYVYHVPEPTDAKKTITAVIENVGDKPMSFRFIRYAFPEPGGDYHKIGKAGLVDYFNGQAPAGTRVLKPGKRMAIDPAMDRAVVGRDILVHGLYEFEIDQPAVVSVLQRDPDADSAKAVDDLKLHPRLMPGHSPSGSGRGLFLASDFDVAAAEENYVLDTADGPQQVIIADGDSDPWILGRDSIEGLEDAPLKGNYGVMYRVKLNYKSTDGQGLALLVYNSRSGGKWCGKQALAVQVNAGEFPGGTVAAPSEQVRYGGPPESVLIQRFPPVAEGETGTIEVLFSPPGASCLPVPLLFVPYTP